MDCTWPEGITGPMRINGSARDLAISGSGAGARIIAADTYGARVRPDRVIDTIDAEPPRQILHQLRGVRCGGKIRQFLANGNADDIPPVAPLNLILDDMIGVMIVSGAAWSQWDAEWFKKLYGDVPLKNLLKAREGACIAHTPGFSAQDPDGAIRDYGEAIAVDPRRADDPEGWHEMEIQAGAGLRRWRRVDITLTDVISVDSAFQDSASRPDGRRSAIHEYGLRVTADPASYEILSVNAQPRVLPYPECPSATAHLSSLAGVRLDDLRQQVSARLPGARGCTHLNDALRALAEVPALLRYVTRG